MDDRPGCLGGLFRLTLITAAYNWLQRQFGFRRGGCAGAGCGLILLFIFIVLVCGTCTNTDWFSLF